MTDRESSELRELLNRIDVKMERIDTKLTVVCGDDGNGGRLAQHEEQIREIQREMAENRPMNRWVERGLLGAIWAAIEYWAHGRG